jgi:hypothetical protein
MFHKWISTDTEEHVQCLTCGGMWVDSDPESVSSSIVAQDGEYASPCNGATDNCHHYTGECPESECKLDPECNCLFCHS